MPTPVPFRICSDIIGGTVEVDGVDVTPSVGGVRFDMVPGQPNLVTLYTVPGAGTIEGDAIVQVVEQLDADPAAAVVEFLESVDPATLEQEALDGHDIARGLTAAILGRLTAIARGDG